MTITRVGVVGSGIMGSGIAQVAAQSGFEVVLRSRSQSTADATHAAMVKSLAKLVDKGRLEAAEAEAIAARVTPVEDLAGLADCDLVIESVVEDLATKRELFTQLDGIVKAGAILATNTSTLPVVEVVRPLTASDETYAEALAFAEACGKAPVTVADQAGFIVNALLFPYLNNAVRLLANGVATAEDIDAAMKGGCNFPMGPLALLDLVGLDTSLAILDALYDEFRDPNYSAVPVLRRMVAAGQLGRKSGQGFYSY